MKPLILTLITIIIIIYSLFAYYYNFINTLLFVFIFLILFFINLIFQKFRVNVPMDKWRLFAIFGSITTSLSLLINAVIFLRNNDTSKITNLINFNKTVFDVFKEINSNFITYNKELGYMYNSIFSRYKSDNNKDNENERNKDLEFIQALIIYRGLNDIYISGNLEVNKNNIEYKGLMNTFNLYTSSNLMREYWKNIKYSLSPDFIKFMENNIFNKRITTDIVRF
jgi:hypothetical protein